MLVCVRPRLSAPGRAHTVCALRIITVGILSRRHVCTPPPPPLSPPPLSPPLPSSSPSCACSVLQSAIVRSHWFKQGMLTIVNGGLAAGASYLVGWGLEQAVGNNACA